MALRTFTLTIGFLAALCFVALPGCQDSASTTTVSDATDGDQDHEGEHKHDDEDADEHEHDFDSISEAVEEIESLRNTIRDEFAAGHADEAHEPLHHMGEVLIAAKNFAKTMEDSEQKTAATEAIASLLADFTAVDDGLHGSDENKSKGKKYADVSDSIDQAIETLKKGSQE
ncbi:MAG: hypothetical protein KDB00_19165 [Planctomycetales bacterium]|nr:hypothetical protein [Planctomycetales bacterium]